MIMHPCDAGNPTLERHAPGDPPQASPRVAPADGPGSAVYDWLTAGKCCDRLDAAPKLQ